MLDFVGVPESLGERLRAQANLTADETSLGVLVNDMAGWLMASRSTSTIKKYSSYFKRFKAFMISHNKSYLPARDIDVALFCTHLLNGNASVAL